MQLNPRVAFVVVLGLFGVAACGGGGGGGGAGSAPPPPPTIVSGFAYVANSAFNDISAFTINAVTGALTPIPCGSGAGCSINNNNFRAGTNPVSVTVDPSAKFVYVANQIGNDVSAYRINAVTGALTQILCGGGTGCVGDNFQALGASGASSIVVDPSLGKFAYMANAFSNDVSAFTINAATGALVQVSCGLGLACGGANFLAGTRPLSVTVDPSAKFAYVANSASNDVSAYTVNAVTGALTQIPCGSGAGCNINNNILAGTRPLSVTIDPSGKVVYVANSGSGDVSAYRINVATGALTQISCGGGAGCNGNNFQAGNSPLSITTTRKI